MTLPRHIYHLAEAANWASIQRHGLLPAAELITRAVPTHSERQRLLLRQRTAHTVLPNKVEIRDQRPMPAAALRACLVGLTPHDWYETINDRVFFWLDPSRLNRQRAACDPRPQVVLTLDTQALLTQYRDHAALTAINSGNARRRPARRGAATFVPYRTWVDSRWASEAVALGTRERKRSHPPAELTITGAVPDAMRYLLEVTHLNAGQPIANDQDIEQRPTTPTTFRHFGSTKHPQHQPDSTTPGRYRQRINTKRRLLTHPLPCRLGGVDDSMDIPEMVTTVVYHGTYHLKLGQFPAGRVVKNYSGAQLRVRSVPARRRSSM